MDTINNATVGVKNLIWGEGENTGTGTGTGSNTSSSTGQKEVHKSMIDDSITESRAYTGKTESDPMAEGAYDPDKQKIETSPEGPASTGGQPQGANLTGQQNTNEKSMSNSNEPNTGFGGGGAQPSVSADPNSAQQETSNQQGADRPNEEPESRGSGESGQTGSGGPPKPSGGGSSGPGGMKLPDDGESKGEGTGQLYEKSTGLQADGGDFDATRPGAAKEAERLMDEAGIKHGLDTKGQPATGDDSKEKKWYGVDHSGFGGHGSHSNKKPSVSDQGGSTKVDNDDVDTTPTTHTSHTSHTTDTTSGVDEGTGKVPLGQKIKDKLHKN